jgi:drug/metabolite transporter (DMT)-like permease
MRIGGLVAWPFVLMVGTYLVYQLMLKLPRPGINVLAFQTLAYAVALVAVGLLWWRNPGLGSNRFELRDVGVAALFGVAVVGLEFGYVSAFRLGWPINTTATMVTIVTAVLLLPIGWLAFRENLSWGNAAGLVLCCSGLWLIAQR